MLVPTGAHFLFHETAILAGSAVEAADSSSPADVSQCGSHSESIAEVTSVLESRSWDISVPGWVWCRECVCRDILAPKEFSTKVWCWNIVVPRDS
eukprot:gene11408-biopygen809